MSKARQKGTSWEVELVPLLRDLFGPQVERAPLKGTQDRGDFTGTPMLVEAKNTQKPLFQAWARTCAKKAPRWVVIWKGDRRRSDPGEGPFVLQPLSQWQEDQRIIEGIAAANTRWERVDL